MEEVLDIYKLPYDTKRPMICMDEASKQLIGETRESIATAPGKPKRIDHEYERNGTANVFMFTEPLRGWRRVEVTDRRTKIDWAHQIRQLVDEDYPDAEVILLVMDNLNTHKKSSLYEAFPPKEAKRIADKLEIHHTPKHGSWLNMAEIELSVLSRQCLSQRIPDKQKLSRYVKAWQKQRNNSNATIDWRFTTGKARVKLRKLYPSFNVT